MRRIRFSTLAIYLALGIGSVGLILWGSGFWSAEGSSHKKELRSSKALLIPPKDLKHFSLGYHEVVADSMWIRVLQDLDYCQANIQPLVATDAESYQKLVEELERSKGPRCDQGWGFHMLDAITELAPKFKAPYVYGSPVLSVVTDDREGARLLYEKGIAQYPNELNLLIGAAYHYLIEVKDSKRAAELLVKAGRAGAPAWVYSLAGHLYTEVGQAFLAKVVLTDALQKVPQEDPDNPVVKRLKERLAAADAVLEREGGARND